MRSAGDVAAYDLWSPSNVLEPAARLRFDALSEYIRVLHRQCISMGAPSLERRNYELINPMLVLQLAH